MIRVTRMISWAIVLCLCLIPLDLQFSPEPVPIGAQIVVEVVDEATHTRIPNATVEVYEDEDCFSGDCVRTDNDMLMTRYAYYWGDELLLVAWHEDYYLSAIRYTVPVYDMTTTVEYFVARIELFKKAINVTAGIDDSMGEFPINISFDVETNLLISVVVPEEDAVFGMAYNWVDLDTDYEYSKGVVIVSSNRILEIPHKYEWQTVNRFYYASEIGRLYAGDGSVIRIPITLFQDCEIGVSVVDTVRLAKILTTHQIDDNTFISILETELFYYHNVSTFVYVNEILNHIGDVQVEYGYQPTYVYPFGYISLDDLRIIWDIPDDTGGELWPDFDIDLVDLCIIVVYAVGVASLIYVARWIYLTWEDRVAEKKDTKMIR